MNLVLRSYSIVRHFGLGWALFRLKQLARQRSGYYERTLPMSSWEAKPLSSFLADKYRGQLLDYHALRCSSESKFIFGRKSCDSCTSALKAYDGHGPDVLRTADAVGNGILRYFESQYVECGFPPNWHRNPFSGTEIPSEQHWSRIPEFAFGDVKLVWEASRFSCAYALVRADWRTADPDYAKTFWLLVEDWRKQNPPNTGVNWKCGQETGLRVMAWCFGLYGFAHAAATTTERVSQLAQMIAVSGERIAAHIEYALSQRNNHGITEATALWTIGILFPEFARSTEWKETGRRYLEQLGRELIYDDGAFSQHSANYHRVMLQSYLWAIRLGEINGEPLSEQLKQRVRVAGEFVYQLQDEQTGGVPNYGQDDGALILPLNNCERTDYRPVVQALHYLCTGKRRFADGPWDEDLYWLFGPEAMSAPVDRDTRADFAAAMGGCWTMRSMKGFAFMRAPSFKHRPSQADALHLDIWWMGINVAIDPGTFSYNAPEPWDNPFAHTRFHNTVTVGELDQMERVGRFMWLPWLQAKGGFCRTTVGDRKKHWEGEHDGYHRVGNTTHRRVVVPGPHDTWIVVDRLTSDAYQEYRLHWLLASVSEERSAQSVHLKLKNGLSYYVEVGSSASSQFTTVKGDQNSARGWTSPHYNDKVPVLSLSITVCGRSVWLWTVLSPRQWRTSFTGESIELVDNKESYRVNLCDGATDTLISSVVSKKSHY